MHSPSVILNFHAVAKLLVLTQMVRCGPSGASTTITFAIIFAILLSISYSRLALIKRSHSNVSKQALLLLLVKPRWSDVAPSVASTAIPSITVAIIPSMAYSNLNQSLILFNFVKHYPTRSIFTRPFYVFETSSRKTKKSGHGGTHKLVQPTLIPYPRSVTWYQLFSPPCMVQQSDGQKMYDTPHNFELMVIAALNWWLSHMLGSQIQWKW